SPRPLLIPPCGARDFPRVAAVGPRAGRAARAASAARGGYSDPRPRDPRGDHRRGHRGGPQGRRRARRIASLVSKPPVVTNPEASAGRWGFLAMIMAAQTVAN